MSIKTIYVKTFGVLHLIKQTATLAGNKCAELLTRQPSNIKRRFRLKFANISAGCICHHERLVIDSYGYLMCVVESGDVVPFIITEGEFGVKLCFDFERFAISEIASHNNLRMRVCETNERADLLRLFVETYSSIVHLN